MRRAIVYSLSLQKKGNWKKVLEYKYKWDKEAAQNIKGGWCTFRIQCTMLVPVAENSSMVAACKSISSHLSRKSSSQKKSLINSGVAFSYMVLLQYWGGPVWQNQKENKKVNSWMSTVMDHYKTRRKNKSTF